MIKDNLCFYQQQGVCLELLAQSNRHSHFELPQYFALEIRPAIELEQIRYYFNHEQQAVCFVTWAWVNQATLRHLKKTNLALKRNHWRCGEQLLFNDFIAPYGGVKEILSELCSEVFPGHTAISFSRDLQGNIIKQHKWKGKDVKNNKRRSQQTDKKVFKPKLS